VYEEKSLPRAVQHKRGEGGKRGKKRPGGAKQQKRYISAQVKERISKKKGKGKGSPTGKNKTEKEKKKKRGTEIAEK